MSTFEVTISARQQAGLDWVVAQRNKEVEAKNAEIKARNAAVEEANRIARIENKEAEKLNKQLAADKKPLLPIKKLLDLEKTIPPVKTDEYLGDRIADVLDSYHRQMVEAQADEKWDKEVETKLK